MDRKDKSPGESLGYFSELLEKKDIVYNKIAEGKKVQSGAKDLAIEFAEVSREWSSPEYDDIREAGEIGDDPEHAREEYEKFNMALKDIKDKNDWTLLYAIFVEEAAEIRGAFPSDQDAQRAADNFQKFATRLAEEVGLA